MICHAGISAGKSSHSFNSQRSIFFSLAQAAAKIKPSACKSPHDNEYCGRLLWYAGWDTLLVTAAGQLLLLHRPETVIGLVSVALELVDLVPVFVSIGLTEKALKRTFTEAGELR